MAPAVAAGHVAGWIGVGGPGLGPGGTDEWVQVGYSAFPTGEAQIYYENAAPNAAPLYHIVQSTLSPGAKNLISVVEVSPGSWQVQVNNAAVSPVIPLPGSQGKFEPQAVGETWNAGTTDCNAYGYSFGGVRVIGKPGTAWKPNKGSLQIKDAQQLLVKTAKDSFTAHSAVTTARKTSSVALTVPADRPPLLSSIASDMLGHKVDTRCVKQSQPVTAQPATLLLSTRVCEVLIGYALAEPNAPGPDTAAGLDVAQVALGFLRGIARASGTVFPQVDCGALERFYQAMRPLGATNAQAVALRKLLLHAAIPIYLPHCKIH